LRSISTFSGLTLISRLLGFLRDVLMAKFLGAGLVSDVFFVAFKLPNFFRRLFAEGAFSAAFVPIFCGLLGNGQSEQKRELAKRFAEDALAVLISVLMVFTVVMLIAMPWFMYLLAPGFDEDPVKFDMAIRLSRITFPYLMLISIVALVGGVLNGLGRFAVGAAAPILMNLTLIGSLAFFNSDTFYTGEMLARAVTIAGIVQLVWMIYGLGRAGVSLRLLIPKITPKVKELGRVMFPIALGAGVMQINLVVDIVLSSFLPEGSLSFLYYADRLNQLPIGVIGVAVGTVLLPTLSRSLGAGKKSRAVYDQNRAMEAALLLTIPASFALFLIPEPLITVLFQRGAFDAHDTAATAFALMAYVTGLPAYVLVKVLAPAFFSRKNTKTPVVIGTIALVVNFVLNVILMQFLAHIGLALATSIASWVNVAMMYRWLYKRNHFRLDSRLMKKIPRIILASALMGVVIFAATYFLKDDFTMGILKSGFLVLGLVVVGFLTYVLAARLFGAVTMEEARLLFRLRAPGRG